MKNQIHKLFKKELERRLKKRLKITWWQCNNEAVMQLIEDHRNRLTRFVVSCKDSVPEHFPVLHVGRIGPKEAPTSLFYEKGSFYRSVEKSQTSQDEAPLVELCAFEKAWVSTILKFLEDKTFFQNDSLDKRETGT